MTSVNIELSELAPWQSNTVQHQLTISYHYTDIKSSGIMKSYKSHFCSKLKNNKSKNKSTGILQKQYKTSVKIYKKMKEMTLHGGSYTHQ